MSGTEDVRASISPHKSASSKFLSPHAKRITEITRSAYKRNWLENSERVFFLYLSDERCTDLINGISVMCCILTFTQAVCEAAHGIARIKQCQSFIILQRARPKKNTASFFLNGDKSLFIITFSNCTMRLESKWGFFVSNDFIAPQDDMYHQIGRN